MRVREAMNRWPPTVREHATLTQALALLDRHRVSVLPVVDPQVRLCGVVSEADLERRPRAGTGWGVPRVRDVMFRHPLTVLDDSDLDEAVELMTSTSLRYLPVLDRSDVVVGLLSRQELVRLVPRSDAVVEREVARLFESLELGWTVRVQHGVVTVEGPRGVHEVSLALTAADTVQGVVDVVVRRSADPAVS